ncbi:MAG: hypothetical protein IKP88_15225 [Lachnospiraceae bacterium]|nr:hypothetical protein [Lachnospiraceae bacterium]
MKDINRDKTIVKAKSEYELLQEEIQRLQTEIANLMAERDDLICRECKEIAADYDEKIGQLELEVLHAQIELHKLKAIIEMLQASINLQKELDEAYARLEAEKKAAQFEEELNRKAEEAKSNREFKKSEEEKEEEWQREQEQKEQERKERKESEAKEKKENGTEKEEERTEDSEAERKYKSRTDEMKALYRKIVKVLHPDVNPDITEKENDMLIEATTAYREGDLETLRKIAAMIDSGAVGDGNVFDEEFDLERLREIVEELKRCVTVLQMEIYGIKTSFPYNMKDFLADEQAVVERQIELRNILKETTEDIVRLEKRIDEMTKGKY